MEYVGRRVKKEFPGRGTFFGLVQSYDPSAGFFRIAYKDGDSEELEFSEVVSLLASPEPLFLEVPQPAALLQEPCARKRGRPKKRRRVIGRGEANGNADICDNLVGRGGDSGELDLNLNGKMDFDGGVNCLFDKDYGVSKAGVGVVLPGLDLNQGLNVGLDLNEEVLERNSVAKKEMIDLNLDVNEEFDGLHDERNKISFDLNLQLMEDDSSNLDGFVGQPGAYEIGYTKGDTHMTKELVINDEMGNGDMNKEEKIDSENTVLLSAPLKRRGRKRKHSVDNKIEMAASEAITEDHGLKNLKMEPENMEETPLKNNLDSVDHNNGSSSSAMRGRRGRKKKELSDHRNSTLPTPDTILRRSSRRSNMALVSGQDNIFNMAELNGFDDQSSSPSVSVVYDEKSRVPYPKKICNQTSPLKVELPPSSCNLDLDEVCASLFLSVYAFLRSFSTLLFLSPFEVDEFVASIKCSDSTPLFDSIHVSLLRAIRKHLEFLVSEGSVSSSDCLRSLNWDYLDLITWPVFVVEYLLLHNPGYIPGLDHCHLKFFQNDYYKLPVSAKVEILHHLCNDVIEVEAFRSELNRRSSLSEGEVDLDRNMKVDSLRKRKAAIDVVSTSCVTEEEADEHFDWNCDECFLCKMDGNLICCDGCPAAFHSRCVGVISNLLPEGDWYCPECAIDKDKPWMKVGKSIRGAKLLGVDLYGRLYYSSCGYLLVLESCNNEYSFRLYNRNGLPRVIEVLDSIPFLYDPIINSVCKHWNIIHEVGGSRHDLDACSYSVQSVFSERRRPSDVYQAPSEALDEDAAERRLIKKSMVTTRSSNKEVCTLEHDDVMLDSDDHGIKLEHRFTSSEGSAEVSQACVKDDNLKSCGLDCSQRCNDIADVSQVPGKFVGVSNAPSAINSTNFTLRVPYMTNYVNCYNFARAASLVFEDVISKQSSKMPNGATRSVEEIIAAQRKVVVKSTDFNWTNLQNSYDNFCKEKCGWCYYCKVPEEGRDCLFIINDCIPVVRSFTSEHLGIKSEYNRNKHLIDVMCHIIWMEDQLLGLLLGPWSNSNYSSLWRECVSEGTHIGAMKNLLLKLEANLHRRALSVDWWKNVDSVPIMGSAAHIVSSSARVSSKQGVGKKRTEGSGLQSTPLSNAISGMTFFWWRGGRGSRDLFSWKVLPRSLVSKAGRQGGFKKVAGVLYPDSGEYAKRTKRDAWRAAVETSKSVEQFALQVRELDANIRWDDIDVTNRLSKIDSESKRSLRFFKKVIIRRKSSEGTMVKYLLDFGRRRFIPDIVVKQGSKIEDSTNQKKKYWLEESHVPLHLLKAFEEKRISRKSNKTSFGKLRESSKILMKSFKKKGFSYLFSRAEKLDSSLCMHCNTDVLISESVNCKHCKDFFHEKHVRKSVGFSMPTYSCHKCWDEKLVKSDARKLKSKFSKVKKPSKQWNPLKSGKKKRRGGKMLPMKLDDTKRAPLVITLRRSARNAERTSKLSLHNMKVKKIKKKKRTKSEKGKLIKPKNSCWSKKRTPAYSSYWLNGLLLSRKPNDERKTCFRSKMLLVLPEEATSFGNKPKCFLCSEMEYASNMAYVSCEICGVWFHGNALNLNTEKIANVIGFKCYKCLSKKAPICPCNRLTEINEAELVSLNIVEMEHIETDSNGSHLPDDGSTVQKFQLTDENDDHLITVNVQEQLPGSIYPESDQNHKSLELNEKILVGFASVEPRKRSLEAFAAVETVSEISNSDLGDREADFSSLNNDL